MAKSTSSNYKTKKEAQNALDRYSTEGNGLQKVIIRIRSIQKK